MSKGESMKKIFITLIAVCVMGQGCVALHYNNNKGLDAKAKDIKTKVGTVDKGKADFTSSVDLWIFFPWKFRTEQKTSMDYWE